jgi:hypothetical protein
MNPLKQIERDVLRRSREWARAELERQLQKQADEMEMICLQTGERLSNTRYRKMKLRTVSGLVRLRVRVGYSQKKRRWINPARQRWGLAPYQQVSPELQARVCQTATLATSYQSAVEIAACWDCDLSDDLIHHHVQQTGARASQLGPLPTPPVPVREFSLVIMMDGWMARERGMDWGVSRRKKTEDRIAWHEVKSAVIYRLEQAVTTGQSPRGLLLEKYIVATAPETDPVDFGQAVQTEALRRGLGKAKRVYVVMDGALWLWCLAKERFREATLILDFHHAREHLMAVGQALYGEDGTAVRQWVDPLIDQLQKGKEHRVVSTLEELLAKLPELSSSQQEVVEREVSYFQDHRDHLHYRRWKRSGAPCGSGAVESLARQLERRFRTCGQFWERPGLTNLLALTVLFRNQDHSPLWN